MGSKLLEYFNNNELAADVWQSKYAQEGEQTPDDMHKRMAKEFAKIDIKYQGVEEFLTQLKKESLSVYGQIREKLTELNIYNYFKDFKHIIPQGSIMSQLGAKSIGSLSNCFVIGQPKDSYGGIFQKDEEMAQLMKRRGGVGIDISALRPKGASTSNAAKTSTGAISFMNRFSNTTREVAQNGRRGALMISIDINHPDVLEFIKIKKDLTKITGANISVKLNNEFMKAVENDEDYILRFPCNITDEYLFGWDYTYKKALLDAKYNELNNGFVSNSFYKKIKAKEYWDEIIKSAHGVAEPGLIFTNNHHNYSPDGVYPQYKGVTTNPCGEIFMQEYDACRLIAVNLYSFVKNPFTTEAEFDYNKFYKINYEAMRLSDDLIDLELEHIDRIIEKVSKDPEQAFIKDREFALWQRIKETAKASRRTGLGFTALGDTLAALGMSYGGDASLLQVEEIMKTKMESELDCTIDLAILRGTFKNVNNNREFEKWDDEHTGEFILKGKNKFYQMLWDEFPEQVNRMKKYGRRNVSWSTVAPTGTVSLLAQTTSGIEPLFQPYYIRRKKVNTEDSVKIDFTDDNGDNWQEFFVLHPKFKEFIKYKSAIVYENIDNAPKRDLDMYFEDSPWYGSVANDINWEKRVEIQGIIQKYITHSISSTINLPNDVSEEEVSKIYMESWKSSLKGITVYRDGSRSGVLISTNKDTISKFQYKDAPKRPKILPCRVHQSTNKGENWLVIVGMLDKYPYEVFCSKNSYNLPNQILEGDLIKIKRGHYRLSIKDICEIEEITSEMTDEQEAVTRLLSTALRHGADIKFLVEQLGKTDGDMFSFTKSIARVLKKYIPNGTSSTLICAECKGTNIIFQEGCMSCKDCGDSKCS